MARGILTDFVGGGDANFRMGNMGLYRGAPFQERSKEKVPGFCINLCRRFDIIACWPEKRHDVREKIIKSGDEKCWERCP